MRQGIKRYIGSFLLDRVCRGVLDTPPLRTDGTPLVFASMVSHADLLRYMLAIKSVHRFFNRGRVVVLDDGSLTEPDLRLLRHHLGQPIVIPIKGVDTGACPKGGTWERLLTIGALAERNYVVQVDSDLLALSPLDEVEGAVARNGSFTQAGKPGETVTDAAAMAAKARAEGDTYVGSLAEQVLDAIEAPFGQRYIHGSSGFAGFPKGQDLRPAIRAFSSEMSRVLGQDTWSRWGSEQSTSNYVVANCPGALALDFNQYPVHWAGIPVDQAKLIHFIGSYRYHRGTYRRCAQRVIREMQARA